jgi:hypothetical protein
MSHMSPAPRPATAALAERLALVECCSHVLLIGDLSRAWAHTPSLTIAYTLARLLALSRSHDHVHLGAPVLGRREDNRLRRLRCFDAHKLLVPVHAPLHPLSDAQRCSAMLSDAQRCSAMLSDAQRCSAAEVGREAACRGCACRGVRAAPHAFVAVRVPHDSVRPSVCRDGGRTAWVDDGHLQGAHGARHGHSHGARGRSHAAGGTPGGGRQGEGAR